MFIFHRWWAVIWPHLAAEGLEIKCSHSLSTLNWGTILKLIELSWEKDASGENDPHLPHVHASIGLSFMPSELTEHRLCEPLVIQDLLAEEQIGAPTTKMLVGPQATGWLVMEVVFSFQQGICYSHSFSLFLYSIKKFKNVYTITKYPELCCGHNVSCQFHVLNSSITCLALSKYFYLGNCHGHVLFASFCQRMKQTG